MSNYFDKIAVTTGDPSGIGAEITIKALNKLSLPCDKVVIISNKKILDYYGQLKQKYELIEIPFNAEVTPGKTNAECGAFSFLSVKKACEIGAKAIVTAPVAKNALHLAGYNFNGQTEILQRFLAHDNQLAEMLFVAGKFRVLLLTRHVPLKEVNLTRETVFNKINTLNDFFIKFFDIQKPKFALCGFNPHAGEDGILGTEEKDILIPAAAKLIKNGVNISGPFPADTLFTRAYDYDCIIANYHDQGLIPIKTVAGRSTVNMTIGLDIIRTSPGHGTAFDIAGKNIADETGMTEALKAVI